MIRVGREIRENVLLPVERQERQVQQNRDPVAVDDEKEGQERVNSGLGDDVGVQAVAQVDRVDVVTAEKKGIASVTSSVRCRG